MPEASTITSGVLESKNRGEIVSPRAAMEAVRAEVGSWEGMTTHDHRFGGIEFRFGRGGLGHLHTTIADLPFPRRIRDELVAAGRARPHHVLPESGWVTVSMRTPADISNIIELFRRNYERDRCSVMRNPRVRRRHGHAKAKARRFSVAWLPPR